MDVLYNDLENYEQEDFIAELKNENKELKCKLEEYASTLSNLQTGFDKLSMEYKKLELNYSSLLKTARAEIERKTQIITNLNLEKDKLVINSMQNRGRKLRSNSNNSHKKLNNKQQEVQPLARGEKFARENKSIDNFLNSTEKNISMTVNNNESKEKLEKRNGSVGPFKSGPDFKEREQTPKSYDQIRDEDKHRIDSKKSKENHSSAVLINEVTKVAPKLSKIRDRRKSMPLLNRSDFKFSSDEEEEDNTKDHRFRRKTPPVRHVFDRLHHDRDHSGRNGPNRNFHDITRVEHRRGSNYEPCRDIYRKTNSRYSDSDKFRSRDNRDKYEPSQRTRKYNNSPERLPFNPYREANYRPHRSDYVRHRLLESPPPEKFNQCHSSRDFDQRRLQNKELHPIKHKLYNVIDEPLSKRMRTDSLTKPPDEYKNILPDRDFGSRAASLSKCDEFSYLSLQSPDYLENNHQIHQIKEIRSTPVTKLDDPRLISKKYIVKTTKDKVEMSTVVGRDVHIECIDMTKWNIDKEIQKMPTPLRERPQTSQDLVNEIYMDIDNPILNFSLESGEIGSEDEIGCVNKYSEMFKPDTVNTNTSTECYEARHPVIKILDDMQGDRKNTTETAGNIQVTCPSIQATCSTVFTKDYKIPKINKVHEAKESENVEIQSSHKLDKIETKQSQKRCTDKEKKNVVLDTQNLSQGFNPLEKFGVEVYKDKKKRSKINRKKSAPEKETVSFRDTVAGDLELSDETCDLTEMCDPKRYTKEENEHLAERSEKNDIVSNDKVLNSVEQNIFKCISNHVDSSNHNTASAKEPYVKKMNFTKPSEDDIRQPKESLAKTTKDDKSKDIKTKLCDLFGDSSSLITPDDLGIVEQPKRKENFNDYSRLFDSTQDAVDLNVEEMEKVQSRSLQKSQDMPETEQNVKSEKKEKSKIKRSSSECKLKSESNIEQTPLTEPILENINTKLEKPNVVKTVIISTGIQNNCQTEDGAQDLEQRIVIPTIQHKVINNEPSCQSLPSLTALATSTPQKITPPEQSVTVPEIACDTHNSMATKDASGVLSNTEDLCNTAQRNVDVPDVRIIVKRRRKTRGTSC